MARNTTQYQPDVLSSRIEELRRGSHGNEVSMKVYRLEDAAKRLGLSPRVLEVLETEGRITACERVSGEPYYSQQALDRLVQDLNCSIQRATWRDMELRMEEVEQRLESLDRELKRLRESSSRIV